MNLLLDDLQDDLIVSDDAENSSEGAVAGYEYSKVAIQFPNFTITQHASDHISSGQVSESVF